MPCQKYGVITLVVTYPYPSVQLTEWHIQLYLSSCQRYEIQSNQFISQSLTSIDIVYSEEKLIAISHLPVAASNQTNHFRKNIRNFLTKTDAFSMTPIRIGNYPFWGPESDLCSTKSFVPGPKCKHPGYGPETIGFLCEYLGKPYEIVNFPKNIPIGGLEADDHWSGMLGLLENGTIDALSVPWVMTEIRQRYFSFTVPTNIFSSAYIIGTRLPTTTQIASRIFVTFHWSLFLTVFATIFTLFTTLVGVHYFWGRNDITQASNTYSDRLIHRATSKHMHQPHIGTKILVLMFTIIIIMFSDLYKDSLLVYLLIPKEDIRLSEDVIWQMVERKQLKMVAIRDEYYNSGTWQNIHDGSNTKFKVFKQALEANPPLLVETFDEVLKIFAANPPDMVYYTDMTRAVHLIIESPMLTLTNVNDPEQNVYGYMFRKNSPLVKEFDEAIKRNTNFIYNRSNYYIYEKEKSTTKIVSKSEVFPLSIVHLLGAFVLWAIGSFIALSLFVTESVFKTHFNKRKKKHLSSIQLTQDSNNFEEVMNAEPLQTDDIEPTFEENVFRNTLTETVAKRWKNYKASHEDHQSTA